MWAVRAASATPNSWQGSGQPSATAMRFVSFGPGIWGRGAILYETLKVLGRILGLSSRPSPGIGGS